MRTGSEKVTLAINDRRGTKRAAEDFGKKLMTTPPDLQTIERRTIAKVSWRLLPLVALAYCISYIDRSNISFASLTMNKDLGFSAYI